LAIVNGSSDSADVSSKPGKIYLSPFMISAALLDQNFITTDDPNHNAGIGVAFSSLAQTFTVGITGILDAVEFNILKASGTIGDLTFDIRSLVAGAPDPLFANALATATVNNNDIDTIGAQPYAWNAITVDVSAFNILVTAGEMLSFVLGTSTGETFIIQTDYLSGYAGGERYSQNGDGNAFSGLSYADLAFKTYVTASVPESTTVVLLGFGLIGLVTARRTRKS